jgi:hypothetical protein
MLAVIGDIHGCLDELRSLAAQIPPEARVICVGDFLDKGPDGIGCVRYAIDHGWEAVQGNHEERYLRYRNHERKAREYPGYVNPMTPIREGEGASYLEGLGEDAWAWLASRPLLIRSEGLVVVHGGVDYRKPWDKQTHALRLRWVNAEGDHVPSDYSKNHGLPGPGLVHWTEKYTGAEPVVYGHESFSLSKPRVHKSPGGAMTYGVDTGCVHGGHLTAMLYEKGAVDFIQVRAKAVYQAPGIPIPE